jgi:hypothetical protein
VLLGPLTGAAVGALLGGAGTAASVAGVGIRDDFVREVEGLMKPGTSALLCGQMVFSFSAGPSWTQIVSFAPAEARTRHGEARTILGANTTGVLHMTAHVDHVMREARMTIHSRPSPVGGGA